MRTSTGSDCLAPDYERVGNRYRIAKIYRAKAYDERGENLRAPLDQPGSRVREGAYLLAVNGKTG